MLRVTRGSLPWSAIPLVVLVLLASTGRAATRGPITLAVDASEVARKIVHVREAIPVQPGAVSLSYPKWIPGEHGPTGPVTDLVGVTISAGGKRLTWQRDLVDMYAIHFTAPAGTQSVEATFDFLSAASPEGFSSAASATQALDLLSWNQVLLYPSGEPSDGLTYAASLVLPEGWRFATALPVQRAGAGRIQFAPVSLTTLIDSPVLAGAHLKSFDVGEPNAPPHSLDVAADGEAALEIGEPQLAHYRALVREAYALFGARHYRSYHWLISLSDHIAHFGLEHHESSDDRAPERMFVDDDLRAASKFLLSHEFVHSWNGKYRRPADLATPNFQEPMRDELLWVYEGLTQYLGWVLAARSGIATADEARENLALQAAVLDRRPGRTWRPLEDTAIEAQLLYEASPLWTEWRRSTDFYNEGLLTWLEADVTIRRLTHGQRSLDDFCRRFHGGASGPPAVVPYTFDDVIHGLNEVAPFDWRSFWDQRLHSLSPHAPLGGIEGGGWKIVYTDSLNRMLDHLQEADEYSDERFSIGLIVNRKDSVIQDVVPGSPAALAGVAPGMKLVAVNGRHWDKHVLTDAIRRSRAAGTVELLVDNGDFYRTCRVSDRAGLRSPHLVRTGTADVLSAILAPHAGKTPR